MYEAPAERPVALQVVVVVDAILVPSCQTSYPATPVSSIDAAHESSTWLVLIGAAVRLVGTDGAVVSITIGVVAAGVPPPPPPQPAMIMDKVRTNRAVAANVLKLFIIPPKVIEQFV